MRMNFLGAAALILTSFVSGYGQNDASLTKAATDKLFQNKVVGVTVRVERGVATLSGKVADITVKMKAETVVAAVAGIKSVINNCTLIPLGLYVPDEDLCLKRLLTNDIQSNPTLRKIPVYVASIVYGNVDLKVVASGGSGYRSPISDRAMSAMAKGETPQQVFRRDRSVGVLVNFERQIRKMSRIKSVSWTSDKPCLPGFVCQTTGGGFEYDAEKGKACAAYRK